jgi:hypothetical protein
MIEKDSFAIEALTRTICKMAMEKSLIMIHLPSKEPSITKISLMFLSKICGKSIKVLSKEIGLMEKGR